MAQRKQRGKRRESKDRYRSFFANALEGLFRSTPEGRFTEVNPALVRMLGYESAEEVLALKLPDDLYVDPTQRAHLRAHYESRGVTEGVELRWKKKSGEHFVVSLYARTLRDTHGTVIGYEGMVLDITERKRMEGVLRQSEARYRTISNLISDYAYAVRIETDGRTVVEWVTEAFSRITGFTAQELEASGGIVRVIHSDDMPSVLQRLSALLSGQPGISEHRIITTSGEVRWLQDYSCPEWDEAQGRIVRIIGAGQDITERKQAEEVLRESEERYRNLFENANDMIVTFTLDGIITSVNRGLEVTLGWSRNELIGQHYSKLATSAALALADERTQRAIVGEQLPSIFEAEIVRKDGSVVPIEVRSRFIRDAAGQPIGVQGIFRDLTERKRAEAAVLEERSRTAREVHDSLAQGFAGIVLQLEAAKHALTVNSKKAQACLEEACALAREGLAEARRSVMALRPQVLEHSDLPAALARVAAQVSTGPQARVTFRVHGSPHPLPVEVESNLLRISQEALHNACKHAQAQTITVTLTFALHRVELCVQDDGRGFNARGSTYGNSFGLLSMRERAERIGGRFILTSRLGKGTKVVVVVPSPHPL